MTERPHREPVRPLDPLRSIKTKLGAVIVAAVAVTVVAIFAGFRLGLPLWLTVLTAAMLALAAIQFLARGMTSPLRQMAIAAQAMARGDYSRQVTATSRDEVGDLARAFNVMAAELAEVDRVRRDLVANVSHELRTPITALQAVLENIVDGVQSAEPETLRVMLAQVERLGRLVSQLLDLSRLESGTVPLEREPFAVRPVLVQAAEEARLHAPDTPVVVDVEDDDLLAHGDAERIHQVVANLLENAVRYSPAGAPVELRARRARPTTGARDRDGSAGATVTIEVSDSGPGIADDEAGRVFERFYRSDAARASSEGGAGLGLAIAKWIVDLHGGQIRPQRREPHGCRMVVTLPSPEGTRS